MSLQLPSLFSVRAKTALITGGATGLGFMMASALVQNGARVIIASRKRAQLEKAVAELNAGAGEGGGAEWVVADVGSKAGCEGLVEEVKRRCEGGLDIVSVLEHDIFRLSSMLIHAFGCELQLVNNSGTTWGAPLTDFPEDKGWDRVLSTNVKAIFWLTAGLATLLEKNATPTNPGRVVNITSVAGIDPKAEGTGLSGPGVGEWRCVVAAAGGLVWTDRTIDGPCRVVELQHVQGESLDGGFHKAPRKLGRVADGPSIALLPQAAANHLTSQLAVSLGTRKITVNAVRPSLLPPPPFPLLPPADLSTRPCTQILPGVFPSNMTAFGIQNDKDNALAGAHPMGRIGAPEDVSGCRASLGVRRRLNTDVFLARAFADCWPAAVPGEPGGRARERSADPDRRGLAVGGEGLLASVIRAMSPSVCATNS